MSAGQITARERIQWEARSWVGTPYHHQARVKRVGCDCIGLIWATGENCGVLCIDAGQVRRYLSYPRNPNPRRMGEALAEFLVEIPEDQAGQGDILWIQWRPGLPMHMAILASYEGRGTMIHAWMNLGAVVEHGYDNEWPSLVHSYWRYPGLAAAIEAGSEV